MEQNNDLFNLCLIYENYWNKLKLIKYENEK